ncbi:MAG: phospho-N-acetylmuramoyl-pentapeptide-transferase [Oscillospiraceae bacterium]|nr:phospho-N-acetylmuramoyl-pentapeptide-transferase [Oscillospiraceae bacterium]
MPLVIRIGVSVAAFIIAAVTGFVLIPYLKKIHFGQTILEIGPAWHKDKQGTPIMGGFMFIIASLVTSAVGYTVYRLTYFDVSGSVAVNGMLKLISCMLFSVCFSAIGFADDYIKAVKKQNLGLSAKQKMIFQFIVCTAFLAAMHFLGDTSTEINLMFIKFNLGIFYYPFMMLVMIYVSNAVNLTDGVDGLCGSVTVVTMLALTTICMMVNEYEVSLFAIAVAGGCLGFLVWNLHPAKCFMGDTGSMYLGGTFVAVSMITHNHLVMILVGIVYILEALSVVIQVSYFKYTARQHFRKTGEKGKGKRIFKMSPIHHHFEMCGYSEYKIVILFSLTAVIAGVASVVLCYNFG